MQGRTAFGDVVPINLEIETTCRHNNAARRRREQDTEGSSNTSPPLSPNHTEMDGKPTRRVTLEDFSNTATPQFFTSIARPEVQAANISYPHSLIQLIQPSHMNEPHPSPHTSQSQEHFVSSPTRPSTKEITKFKSNPANHPLILSHPAPNLFGQSSPNPFQPHKALLTLISANFSYFWDKIVSTYPLIVIVFL